MIFKNVELYNVSELRESGSFDAYKMLRVPGEIEGQLNEKAQDMNNNNCGVEIRFDISKSDVKLKLVSDGKTRPAVVYYGSVPAGFPNSLMMIGTEPTEIVIPKPDERTMARLEQITELNNFPFDPHIARVILQNQKTCIIDVEGDTEPPRADQVPKKRYLAYGSSITHGSMALLPTNTYAYRTAEFFKADLINLGFAGSCHIEKEMAEYIASRNDWDFASFELGINVLFKIDEEEYRKRVETFIPIVAKAHPDKKIFAIDLFYCAEDMKGTDEAQKFRRVLKETVDKLGFKNVVYVNGLDILTGSHGLTSDLVHPNIRGMEEMADNLTKFMSKYIEV